MEQFFLADSEIIIRLLSAVVLGSLLGLQRSLIGKMAGMRTYALVSLGSALFVIVSQMAASPYINITNFDPLRVAAQIIAGIGFIGAGLIIFQENKLNGLTTAAGLWVSAGLGMAAGFGLYFPALVTTILALTIFSIFWYIETGIVRLSEMRKMSDDERAYEEVH
jgi:putative Mg2+ transporter-C (MgtC) family protein